MVVVIIALIVFLLNIPFGYWRTNVRKFSIQWIMAIHIPVPLVVILRIYSEMGFELYTYPILIGAFFLGQFTGKRIFEIYDKKTGLKLSSCLVMDSFRLIRNRGSV